MTLKKIPEAAEEAAEESGWVAVFFLPYKIERRFRSFPWVTVALIATNVFVYFATLQLTPEIWFTLGFSPTSAAGAFTWLTSMFLHGGLMHLLGNMYFLWLFGSMAEDGLGKGRYLLLYFVGGLGSCVMHAAMTALAGQDAIPLIGASGAIGSVIGVVAVRMRHAKIKVAYLYAIFLYFRAGVWRMSAAMGVALYLLQEVGYGMLSMMIPGGTAHWAHVGGLIVGITLALSWGSLKEASKEYLAEEAKGYMVAGMGDVAVAKYGELVEKDPDNPDFLLDKIHSGTMATVVVPERLAEDFDQLVPMLKTAERTNDIIETYRVLARQMGLEQALSASTLQAVASAAESVRDYDIAQRAYGTLMVVHPTSPEAERGLFRLAHIYLARGMAEDACQAWRAFLESYPQSAWLPYADSQLAG